MRRLATVAALIGASVLLARALAPRLHERLMAGCERMFERMPDSFPPKRMMREVEEIRANSVRTLALLEARNQPTEAVRHHEVAQAGQRATRLGGREQEELAGVGVSSPQHDLPLDAKEGKP